MKHTGDKKKEKKSTFNIKHNFRRRKKSFSVVSVIIYLRYTSDLLLFDTATCHFMVELVGWGEGGRDVERIGKTQIKK